MRGLGEQVAQEADELLGQGLVEEKAHQSGRRQADGSTLSFGRVGQAGSNVFG